MGTYTITVLPGDGIGPEVTEQAVLRALAKEHKERFASVQDFATALERASQLGPSDAVLPPRQLITRP